ncbi:MAG TPA: hypothetical protein V6C76_09590 [Drouetiella sp.]
MYEATSTAVGNSAAISGGKVKQAWLSSPGWDCLWIIGPAFISSTVVLLFRGQMEASSNVPLWVWICFVLLIDVAHVYATLFRTYFDPKALEKNRGVLLAMPAIAWVGGALLYSLNALYFWRTLAYLAVFHFIRQQFGFVVLYSRKDPEALKRFKWLDCAAIYMATIYPMLFWHTSMPRNFVWFVAGDFIESAPEMLATAGLWLYVGVACLYFSKELFFAASTKYFNIPRNLIIIGTALSWWTGIITMNSDMAFTITNVVSHGVPYMALIWLYHRNPEGSTAEKLVKNRDWKKLLISNVAIFFAFLVFLAYVEEGFWDGFVWREHLGLFAPFASLPQIGDAAVLALLVPFLALPQSTHYLLDGFIWRVKDRSNVWSA